jgi:threonine dehydratase
VPEAPVTPADVRRAAAAISDAIHRTPTFSSRSLGPGRYLKAELFQRTGSFKARGALNRVRALTADERTRGVISVSAGNHAQALAWAAAAEEVDALVVMWQGASTAKIDATRAYGAQVDLDAAGPGEAFARLHVLEEQTGRVFVHPFDDPTVIAGAGTVGLEILEDVPDVDTIVVACGGGGLVSGIAAACIPAGVRVIAVEPEGSNALALGLAAGAPVPVTPLTIADALTAPFTGGVPIEICRTLGVPVVLVSEDEIEDGFRFLYSRMPAVGSSASSAVSRRPAAPAADNTL